VRNWYKPLMSGVNLQRKTFERVGSEQRGCPVLAEDHNRYDGLSVYSHPRVPDVSIRRATFR
jgi:hypothetical protein